MPPNQDTYPEEDSSELITTTKLCMGDISFLRKNNIKQQNGISPAKTSDEVSIKADLEAEARLHKRGLYSAIIIILNFFYGQVNLAWNMTPDKRQNGWIMMQTPVTTLFLSMLFIFFVTVLGPRIMRGRAPMKGLKKLMIAYNVVQIVMSTWIFYMSSIGGWMTNYSWFCQLCDFSDSPQAVMMLSAAYWYYIAKIVDFIDTIFFVAHKKFEHISLLHVVHHAIMPVNCWFGLRFMPGGHPTFGFFLNCWIHMVMYTYYLLSALGPQFKKYLWWKKYLTKMQLLQFGMVILHSLQVMFTDCPIPAPVMRWVFGTAALFMSLFADFYWKAYVAKTKQKALDDKKVQ